MSSTLESLHMYVSDATVLRANSRNPWSNVLNFGWKTLLTLLSQFRELACRLKLLFADVQLHQTRVSLQGRRRDALD